MRLPTQNICNVVSRSKKGPHKIVSFKNELSKKNLQKRRKKRREQGVTESKG